MDALFAAEAASASGGGDGYWQLAMVLAGIGLLGLFARWRKARNPAPPETAKQIRERDQEPNRYRDAADRAMVELLEAGREISGQVDVKIRFLNRLVKEADEKIARLEKLLNLAEKAETGETVPAGSEKPESATAPTQATEQPAADGTRSRRFRSPLHERIFSLHDEGKSLADIAKATNLSTTEVRFVLESMGAAT